MKASAPGKLYITGEYAVLEPHHPAILVAVDRFITVSVTKSINNISEGSISSSYTKHLPIPWTRRNGTVFVDERENPFNYVTQAIQTTEAYIQEHGKQLDFYHIEINSDLATEDGRKYGLGSSGAVTVATIKALLKYYQLPYDNMIVYKLSVLAHLAIGSNGSFGDIAASSFGGWLAYSIFDKQWLIDFCQSHTLTEIVHSEWKDLYIESLEAPTHLKLYIGWTGSPASTTHLVDQLHHEEKKEATPEFHEYFLKRAKDIVTQTIQAFKKKDEDAIGPLLEQYRQLLQELAKHRHLCIETPQLTKLCQIAASSGGFGKSSGAGGGDCGIVLLNKDIDPLPMIQQWQQHHIKYLDFNVFKSKDE